MSDYKFEGWLGMDEHSIGKMQWKQYEPKPFLEDDVDIQITHSGICGSDIHVLRSGWAPSDYPVVVGHEIVGKVVRAGPKVENGIKLGDRVGVGAQARSCLQPDCGECSEGTEQYCVRQTQTFNSKFPGGHKSYGGYALYNRTPSHFVFKIPDTVQSQDAAPMLCGGATVYSPLKHNGCGPGKKVGIIGLGGLGHFGVLFAKALKADKVVAISRSRNKEADARKMGADDFIATSEDKDWQTTQASSLDLIISTVSDHRMPFQGYINLLKTKGRLIIVGAPEDNLPGFNGFSIIPKGAHIGGSAIGSPVDIKEMLELAGKVQLKPWIEQRPMSDANQATIDMDKNLARYRYCLTN